MSYKTTWLKFSNGKFEPVSEPDWYTAEPLSEKPTHNPSDVYHAAGFDCAQCFGQGYGVGFELWRTNFETSRIRGEQWFIDFSDGRRFIGILCSTWIDLIELLAKLSPVALAAGMERNDLGEAEWRVKRTVNDADQA